MNTILLNSYIKDQFKEELFINVLDNATDSYLNDNIIDDQEKKMVARYIQFSGLPTNGLQKDGANDKPIFLKDLNSWFTYNIIANFKN